MADKDQKSASHLSPFDAIRHVDEQLGEYWSARELYKISGYTEWRNFHNVVIKRAIKACEENGRVVSEHFVQSYKMSKTGQGGKPCAAKVARTVWSRGKAQALPIAT
jgi:hypothetical protein